MVEGNGLENRQGATLREFESRSLRRVIIMNEELQKSLSYGIIIIAISIGYYFLWYMPKQNKNEHSEKMQQEMLVNQQKCQQVASSIYEKDAKEMKSLGAVLLNPEYKYDDTSGMCLYLGGILDRGQIHRFIIDVYTNKTIAEYILDENNTVVFGDKIDFEKTKSVYFLIDN